MFFSVHRQSFLQDFILLQRGTYHFFLCLKEKSSKKEAGEPAARPAYRAINCVAPSFSASGIAVPQNSASIVRRAKRLGFVGSRTGGFDLMARVRVGALFRELTERYLVR